MGKGEVLEYLSEKKGAGKYLIGKTEVKVERWLPKGEGEIFLTREDRPTGDSIISLCGSDASGIYNHVEKLRGFKQELRKHKIGKEPEGMLRSILYSLGSYDKKPDSLRDFLRGLTATLRFDEKRSLKFTEIYNPEGEPVGRVEGNIITVRKGTRVYQTLKDDMQFFKESDGDYVSFRFEEDFGKAVDRCLEDLSEEELERREEEGSIESEERNKGIRADQELFQQLADLLEGKT